MLAVNGLGILRNKRMKVTPTGTDVLEAFVSFQTSKKDTQNKFIWSAVEVVAFGKTATLIDKHVHKGDTFVVQNGELRSDEWVDKNGSKRTSYQVVIDKMGFVPSDKKGN